jgi:hypothetical protein
MKLAAILGQIDSGSGCTDDVVALVAELTWLGGAEHPVDSEIETARRRLDQLGYRWQEEVS